MTMPDHDAATMYSAALVRDSCLAVTEAGDGGSGIAVLLEPARIYSTGHSRRTARVRGAGVPPFRRERGLVPADLLDLLPDAEIEAIGWQASALMQPDAAALGNSGAPLPLPETPAPMTAG